MSQTEGLKAHFPIVFSKAQQSNHHPQPPLRGHLEAAPWHCIVPAQGGYVVWPELSLKSVISLLQTAGASVNSDRESHSSPWLVNRKREGKTSQHPESVPGWKTHSHEGATAAGGGRPGVLCSWVCLTVGHVALASMALVGSHDSPGSPELCQLSLEAACSSEATHHLTYLCFTHKHTQGHLSCLTKTHCMPHPAHEHTSQICTCVHARTQVRTTHKYTYTVHGHTCTHTRGRALTPQARGYHFNHERLLPPGGSNVDQQVQNHHESLY